MNEGKFETLTRDEVKALAGEVLEAMGVEKAEMTDEEREVLRRAIEDWRRQKKKDDEGI